jgi:hypothetical protein
MRTFVEQVGGDHYQSQYGHWDWVAETGLGYLEGNATKYIGRWRNKGGKKDLEKALSYIKKLIAVHFGEVRVTSEVPAGWRSGRSGSKLYSYVTYANLNLVEADLTKRIDGWKIREDLEKIIEDLEAWIDETGD